MTEQERPQFECAHKPPHKADFRRIINGQMLWMCRSHSDFHALKEAKQFCAERDLHTVDEMRAWIKAHPMGQGRMHGAFLERYRQEERFRRSLEREPGEDDE